MAEKGEHHRKRWQRELDRNGCSPLSSLTDFLVLASGSSDRQVQASAEAVHQGNGLIHGFGDAASPELGPGEAP